MIDAILLAGGASRRMGRPKALLEFQGERFLDRLIRIYTPRVDRVIVVLGHQADEIHAALRPSRAEFVRNPDPERGQFSSLQTGLAASAAEAVLFQPIDYPAVAASTLDELLAAGPGFAIPRYAGERGHPILLDRPLMDALLALPATAQARDVTRAQYGRARFVDVDDAGIVTDIDAPADYEQLLARTHA